MTISENDCPRTFVMIENHDREERAPVRGCFSGMHPVSSLAHYPIIVPVRFCLKVPGNYLTQLVVVDQSGVLPPPPVLKAASSMSSRIPLGTLRILKASFAMKMTRYSRHFDLSFTS